MIFTFVGEFSYIKIYYKKKKKNVYPKKRKLIEHEKLKAFHAQGKVKFDVFLYSG